MDISCTRLFELSSFLCHEGSYLVLIGCWHTRACSTSPERVAEMSEFHLPCLAVAS